MLNYILQPVLQKTAGFPGTKLPPSEAVWTLGQQRLGKYKGKFYISRILNSRKEDILRQSYDGVQILKERYYPETLAGYAQFRMKQMQRNGSRAMLKFQTETDIRYQKQKMTEFSMEAIVSNLARRTYLFDCFEGTHMDLDIFMEEMLSDLPQISSQNISTIQIKRFSNRQLSSMRLEGIKGGMAGQIA